MLQGDLAIWEIVDLHVRIFPEEIKSQVNRMLVDGLPPSG